MVNKAVTLSLAMPVLVLDSISSVLPERASSVEAPRTIWLGDDDEDEDDLDDEDLDDDLLDDEDDDEDVGDDPDGDDEESDDDDLDDVDEDGDEDEDLTAGRNAPSRVH